MSYPDPKQRTVLGWQIRWIAGLFSLLMVVAGSLPTYSGESSDPTPLDATSFACPASAQDERVCPPDLTAATGEFLKADSAPTWEPETEKKESVGSTSPEPPKLVCDHDPQSTSRRDDRSPQSIDASGQLATRAPPLA